jgi:hypothetical protein
VKSLRPIINPATSVISIRAGRESCRQLKMRMTIIPTITF